MEQEEIKEIEEIEEKAEVEQPLTEVVDKQDVDTLVIELKQEYEKKLLEQKQMYEGKLKERDNIIKHPVQRYCGGLHLPHIQRGRLRQHYPLQPLYLLEWRPLRHSPLLS